jgi:hypothetical protein
MTAPVSGDVEAIFGINSTGLGCNCECHLICGAHVNINFLIYFKKTTLDAGRHKNIYPKFTSYFL